MGDWKGFWLKVRMFLNNLSPLRPVYLKDKAGNYIVDKEGNPVSDRYTPPWILRHLIGLLVLGVIIYAIYLISQVYYNFKTKKT